MEILDQPQSPEGEYNFSQKTASLLHDGFNFDLGGYISKGHKILKSDLGRFIGYELLVFLISIGIGMVPVAGTIANFIIGNSLFIGFAIFARRIYLNLPRTFSNFFDGFRLVGPLVLLRLLNAILIGIIAIPYLLITMGSFFLTIFRKAFTNDASDIDPSYILSNILKLIPLFVVIIIIQVLLAFSTYMVTFGRIGAIEAITLSMKIVGKKFLSFFLFFIVLILINIGGALLLVVGLLYTIPLTLCAMYAAYESIVGTNPRDELLDNKPVSGAPLVTPVD